MTTLTLIIWAAAVMVAMALVARLFNEDFIARPASSAAGVRRHRSMVRCLAMRVLCSRRESQRHTRPARLILYDLRVDAPGRGGVGTAGHKMGMIYLYALPSPYRRGLRPSPAHDSTQMGLV